MKQAETEVLMGDEQPRERRGPRRFTQERRAELVREHEESRAQFHDFAHWVQRARRAKTGMPGVAIPRSTLCDWIRIASDWLEPIYKCMLRGLLAGDYLQADETPVKCQDPDNAKAGVFQGYLWVVSRPPGDDVCFDWRTSPVERSMKAPGRSLTGFLGHPDAGRRAAILYSLIVSCLCHDKDLAAYLRDVLARCPR